MIVAASIGNALELFDFTVFSFFAAIIGQQFFPAGSETGQLLLALATFGVGFVARPAGSVIIGGYADRHGRRAAMTLTIGLMVFGTALIGCTPVYSQIGIVAPILIVAGRLLQGLSAGGEVGTSTVYLMESGALERRGYMVSWQMASQGASVLLGALFGFLLTRALSREDLMAWGWRVPFIFGLLIGPVGFYIRKNLHETLVRGESRRWPIAELLHRYAGRVGHGVLLIISGTTAVYILGFYMPLYAVKELHLPQAASYLSGCAAGIAITAGAFVSSRVLDYVRSRKTVLYATSGATLLLVYPLLALVYYRPSIALLILVVFVIMFICAIGAAAFLLLILEQFPAHIRVTGLSATYAIGVTIFGGFAQFNVTWLLRATGNPMSLAWYLLVTSGISFFALFSFREIDKEQQ
ncbi:MULTISPECIES: MFS transporter [unclassified Burkholderia]|uniref:MFS transporter n=1 Tax=unclassified Burkholderia TaxID=2613784 RepID=UPI002ABE2E9F|nr:MULTISPECIES: MFS transporter [unclassified Burkholderia]